jgi:hypothetical protein
MRLVSICCRPVAVGTHTAKHDRMCNLFVIGATSRRGLVGCIKRNLSSVRILPDKLRAHTQAKARDGVFIGAAAAVSWMAEDNTPCSCRELCQASYSEQHLLVMCQYHAVFPRILPEATVSI